MSSSEFIRCKSKKIHARHRTRVFQIKTLLVAPSASSRLAHRRAIALVCAPGLRSELVCRETLYFEMAKRAQIPGRDYARLKMLAIHLVVSATSSRTVPCLPSVAPARI
jgi:hypothetical protein